MAVNRKIQRPRPLTYREKTLAVWTLGILMEVNKIGCLPLNGCAEFATKVIISSRPGLFRDLKFEGILLASAFHYSPTTEIMHSYILWPSKHLIFSFSRGQGNSIHQREAKRKKKEESKSLMLFSCSKIVISPILTVLVLLLFHCQVALERYNKMRSNAPERLVSGSDDFTMFLWEPAVSKHPKTRMTGHQQLVNHVYFSPDGQWIASASFDKSVKLWNGTTGKFVAAFRGHVGPVYQISWSADSRLLLSGSKDSTLKIWDIRTKKLKQDLPGHADEVFAVDWSPDGEKVASGGKDRVLKLWMG